MCLTQQFRATRVTHNTTTLLLPLLLVLQESLKHSAEAVKSAVQGAGGVLVTGSTFISPEERSSGSSIQNRINTTEGGYDTDAPPPVQRLRFRGLEPKRRYVISLCTESNSGSLSGVTVAEAEAHGEAPLVSDFVRSGIYVQPTMCFL